MRKYLLPGLFVLLLAPSVRAASKDEASSADEAPPPDHVQLGMRMGVAVPSGKLDDDDDMSEALGVAFTTDLMLDLRIGDRFILTPYAGYAQGFSAGAVDDACEASRGTDECKMVGLQIGGMARYALLRTMATESWAGYGFSREWRVAGGRGVVGTFAGNEHHAVAGVDFFVRGAARMGVYADVSFGTYDSAEVHGPGGTWRAKTPATHRWTALGFQAFF